MKAFYFALTFLTRIPAPVKVEYHHELPSKSLKFYPLIGTIIGMILILLDLLLSQLFSNRIVNTLLLISLVYVTGGLHLDGFIDSIDGLFSCREKKRILEIMHDSLIGAFGALAVILLLLLKFNLFLELTSPFRWPLFLFMPSMSRFLVVVAAKRYPLATSSTLGKGFNYYLTWREVGVAGMYVLILILAIAYLFSSTWYVPFFILTVSYFVMVSFANYVIKKIGGLTGDVYGAINEICEVTVLLSFLLINHFI